MKNAIQTLKEPRTHSVSELFSLGRLIFAQKHSAGAPKKATPDISR
jgi:hypothetical protein